MSKGHLVCVCMCNPHVPVPWVVKRCVAVEPSVLPDDSWENFGETQIGKVVYRDFSLVNSKMMATAPDVHHSEQPVNFHVEDRSPPGT
ncbi:hypothetical protein RUM43_003925, partial [Polyplax serrata]